MKKNFVLFVFLIISLTFIGCNSQSKTNSRETFDTLKTMPEFKCKDTKDGYITKDIFKGKNLTMVNIWGTGCKPCIDELPYLEELNNELKSQNFQIIGVVGDGLSNEITAIKILNHEKINFINMIPNEEFIKEFVSRTSETPVSIFINNKGQRVGEIIIGSKSKEEYKNIIKKTLMEIQ
ncbi:TlpA family protein disulfide reductase [Clostridium rectalis]|uniref:TlpA family protein disulfide reductase n=1 Tax=Clostridium rectalis TaxID=2040295 RepID=UPI000F64276A|nr:TlpA disulfide reductase family protein [Clostridium rectalis]